MTTLGAVLRPQLAPEGLRSVARAADDAGLGELWLWEDCFREGGLTSAAAVLAWTERVRVGVGLLPVPLRNVALTAMEAATLHRMFPGRVTLGVGHGVQDWMGQAGARPESPLTLLREHLLALRALLRGERVTTSGRYVRLDDVALDWPPAPEDAAVLAGGTGPRTVRLTGEAADGTILTANTSAEGCAGPAVSSTRGARRPGAGPSRTGWSSTCSPPPAPVPPGGCAPNWTPRGRRPTRTSVPPGTPVPWRGRCGGWPRPARTR